MVHARYALAGGEERVVDTQEAVLTSLGHQVVRYEEDNAQVANAGVGVKARTAVTSVWSRQSRRNVAFVIARERPDVVHVHNHFPRISPSVYAAANAAGVPVIQHLHNARLVCIQPFLLRDGAPCHKCVGHSPLPGVRYRCYRDSYAESAVAASVQMAHRALGTWRNRVTRFVAVSESLAATYRASGVVPETKLVVCENGLDHDPGARVPGDDAGYALFAGRLSEEKGVDTLIDAARALPEIQVVIAGDGPARAGLEQHAAGLANVSFAGHVERDRMFDLLRRARVLVAPSRGEEPFGIAVIEAAAVGVPAVVSNSGALPDIVRDGQTGVVVSPDDPHAIVAALVKLRDVTAAHALGAAARAQFEARFSPASFGPRLIALYDEVLRQAP